MSNPTHGQTEIHDRLIASAEHLLADARAAALGLGDEIAWVERLVIATEPKVDRASLASREDALGDLQRMLSDAGKDAAVLEQMKADIGEFVRRLPHEVRTDSEDHILKAAINGEHTALISQVTDYLTARIAGGDE